MNVYVSTVRVPDVGGDVQGQRGMGGEGRGGRDKWANNPLYTKVYFQGCQVSANIVFLFLPFLWGWAIFF